MNPWVRGKALQIIIDLREIRPGDHIRMRMCGVENHTAVDDATFVRMPYLIVSGVDNHERWPVDLNTPDDVGTYSTCWCGIKAWRRP